MDRVLITGVAGFLGSNLAQKLLENDNISVYGIDDFSSSTMSNLYPILRNDRFNFIEASLTDELDDIYDTIYHFIGDGSLKNFHENKFNYITSQIDMIKTLIKHCEQCGAKLITTTSYSDFSKHNENKFELYNLNTLINDLIIYSTKHSKLNAKILRIDEIYGKNMLINDKRFIPNTIYKALKNQTIELEYDKSCYFTYIDDVIKSLINLNNTYYDEIIIDSFSQDLYLMSDVAKLIISYTKSNSTLDIKLIEQISPNYAPSIKNLDFKCSTPILKGISETIDYFKLIYFS